MLQWGERACEEVDLNPPETLSPARTDTCPPNACPSDLGGFGICARSACGGASFYSTTLDLQRSRNSGRCSVGGFGTRILGERSISVERHHRAERSKMLSRNCCEKLDSRRTSSGCREWRVTSEPSGSKGRKARSIRSSALRLSSRLAWRCG